MKPKTVYTTFNQPAAGHDLSNIPNYSDRHKLLCLRAEFVTSATVANRFPHLQLLDQNGAVYWELVPATAQTEGQTTFYCWSLDNAASANGTALVDNVAAIGLPNFWVPPQFTWQTKTTAIAAGDQWSNVTTIYEVGDEWERLVYLEELIAAQGS